MKRTMTGLIALALLVGVGAAWARDPAEGDVAVANPNYLVLPAVPVTVTNGQALTVAASHYAITPSESATITLVAPTDAQEGMLLMLTESGAGTYHFTIADSGTAQLAGAFVSAGVSANALFLMAQSNIWVQQMWSLTSATTMDVTGNTTVGGTLSVTGVATFAAESVHDGGVDADYITTDAAAGIDTKTAGTLAVGASTATKVEISDTGVGCEVQGPLTAKEDILSDELDTETATALLLGKATATSVTVGASDINVAIAGTFSAPRVLTVTEATTTRVSTSADYGKWILVNTNAAVAITLPANGAAAGSWVGVMVHGAASDDCAPTISAASADTLIGPNDVDLDSVTWGTGHRIGAQAMFWSDGSFWHVQNLGGTTMTYTD